MRGNSKHVTKADFVRELRSRLRAIDDVKTSLPLKTVSRMVDELFATVVSKLEEGHVVDVRGFGRFDGIVRGGRVGRNPRSGEPMQIAASKTVRFRASQTIRARITTAEESLDT